MSRLIVHYDPSQRSCFFHEANRDKQARLFEKAVPSSSILGTHSTNTRAEAKNRQRRNASPNRSRVTNFERLNRQFLREVQEKNRQALHQSIRTVGREVKSEVVLREKNSHTAHPTAIQELSLPSPRRAREGTQAQRFAVADSVGNDTSFVSNSSGADDPLQRSGVVPPYIEQAKDQSRMRGGERVALKQLAIAEAEFPPGTEPLSPARTFRSREFFEAQVAELSQKLRDFSFRQAQSLLGQKRKAELEQALRQAEEQLLIFQYPVVFVHTNRPVLARPQKQATTWR